MGKETQGYFGVHFMLDGYNAPSDILKDKEVLWQMLTELPKKMGMYALAEPVLAEVGPNNKKDPGGLSGVVLIAESHISFHTFPGRGFVTIDVYTCQDEIDTEAFIEEFRQVFQFTAQDTHYIRRGTSYPAENIYDEVEIQHV